MPEEGICGPPRLGKAKGKGKDKSKSKSKSKSKTPTSAKEAEVGHRWMLGHDDEGTHHVVLLVFEDVAVPDVLVAAHQSGTRAAGNGEGEVLG